MLLSMVYIKVHYLVKQIKRKVYEKSLNNLQFKSFTWWLSTYYFITINHLK